MGQYGLPLCYHSNGFVLIVWFGDYRGRYCSLLATSVPTQDDMVREPSFTPGDDTALASSWREASTRHDEQSSLIFWSGVAFCLKIKSTEVILTTHTRVCKHVGEFFSDKYKTTWLQRKPTMQSPYPARRTKMRCKASCTYIVVGQRKLTGLKILARALLRDHCKLWRYSEVVRNLVLKWNKFLARVS